MRPVTANEDQIAYWANADDIEVERQVVIGGPEEAPDVIPCPALITSTSVGPVVRVAFELDEIEVAALAQGGTLWLSTWGGLPIHMIEVQPPTPRTCEGIDCR